jgi:hypothetical protein
VQDDCRANALTFCLGFLIAEVVVNCATLVLSVSALDDLKWKRYKAVGPEVKVAELYQKYELFSAFRKVDFQFSLIILYTGIIYTATNLGNRTAQFTLGANIVLVPIELAWEITGIFGVRKRDPWYIYAFWVLSVFMPMLIASLVGDFFTENNVLQLATTEVRITVGVFAALAVANRICTVVCSALLFRAFDQPAYPALQRIIVSGRAAFGRSRIVSPQPRKPRGASGGVIPNPLALSPTSAVVAVSPRQLSSSQNDQTLVSDGGAGSVDAGAQDDWDTDGAPNEADNSEGYEPGISIELATLAAQASRAPH